MDNLKHNHNEEEIEYDKHHHHEDDECEDECCHHHHEDDECEDGCCCHHHHNDEKHDEKKERTILIIRVIVSAIILVVGFLINHQIISPILMGISYLIIGYDVLINAFNNIIHGELFDETFLMSLASLTALVVSIVAPESGIDGYDGVLVMLLYQIGEFLQDLAIDKSKESITEMLDVDVDTVIKLEQGKEKEIKLEEIEIGDILVIKPCQKIPTDGIIIKGNSSINTSSLTGESKPLDVYENDKVLSGCINNEGLLEIKAITNSENSTAAKVKNVIKQASKKKAKSERFITKFARIYTPIVIVISLIVMFVIPLILGFNEYFMQYLYCRK